MGFASLIFWFCFTVYFVIYWLVLNKPNRLRARNASLLIASYLFYASWDWRFLGIILFSSVVDYLVGIKLSQVINQRVRKNYLILSVMVNLGFLAIFKYHNFFIESAQATLSLFGIAEGLNHLNWVLPVGISFYTFQTMSYTIDVYRRQMRATKDPLVFFTYIAFFPQLLAGPIERAKDLIPQFEKIQSFELDASKKALLRILWGAFKKVVIANRLAIFVNEGYANPGQLTGLSATLVIVFFVIQLYCDFSGYCDMAIGSARLMGFKLSENFTRPFLAKNIRTVYQRWHITIHRWLRDYVYFSFSKPKTKLRWGLNVIIVFGLAGLWHGSGINFLLWGVISGLLILTLDPLIDYANTINKKLYIFFMIVAHISVYLSLVFFRSQNLEQAKSIFLALSRWEGSFVGLSTLLDQLKLGLGTIELFVGLLFIVMVFVVEVIQEFYPQRAISFYQGHGLGRWAAALGLALCILFFGFYNNRPGELNLSKQEENYEHKEFLYEEF